MEIKILKEEKGLIDLEIDNLTIVELLRVYLNKEDVKMAAWRRDHPTKNPVLRVEADNAKKLVLKTIEKIQKDIDNFADEYKKAK
jgi:DNA-directed RNA polymerase subunit L